ncbi:hypothetical protein [Nonomuraea sp. NPDC050643]|uniref:hypothetical protein n=1 Tax=Nonomuraea sp. NPDC050643 TaxID=3155660 RepID=UPI0033ECCDAB
MQSPPDIRAIEVTPQPVVLDAAPAEILIEVAAIRATTVTGRLIAPDGTELTLAFTHRLAPCEWQAAHLFQPGDLEGAWRLQVSSGQATAGCGVALARRGSRAEARFADFDAQPPQVPRGDLVRLTGRVGPVKDGASGPAGGLDVVLAFREDNTCGWRELAETVTDDAGRFAAEAPVMASGDWRAEVRTTPGVIGGRSEAVFVEATSLQPYETQIVGYRVRLLGEETVHTGRLRGKSVATWE